MEHNLSHNYRIIDLLIENGVRFALYRLANQKDINLVIQSSSNTLTLDNLRELNLRKGFVVAPFHISPHTPLVVINPDIYVKGEEEVFRFLSTFNYKGNSGLTDLGIKSQPSLNTFGQYTSVYNTFHTALNGVTYKKLVLSRTFDVPLESGFSAGVSFRQACEKYGANFVFVCHTPETGAWMGISPELLVFEQGNIYKTVALAGTKKVNSGDWDEKNREEQQIVVDYMRQQLSKVSSHIEQRGAITVQAGNIEHLKTKFSFLLKEQYKIGDLLDLLHPSPAVCGFPKEAAFSFILKNELYDRRYYSGFVGPLDMDGQSRLYVNLRCMQVGKGMLRLYAGGGMLPSSELRSEWEETENKLQTILSIIN